MYAGSVVSSSRSQSYAKPTASICRRKFAIAAAVVIARVDAVLDGVVLGRQAERVPAHRVQHAEPLHPLPARDDVGRGVALAVADVQARAGRVGEHVQRVELRLRGIGWGLVQPGLAPARLPFGLNGSVLVGHEPRNIPRDWHLDCSAVPRAIIERDLLGRSPAAWCFARGSAAAQAPPALPERWPETAPAIPIAAAARVQERWYGWQTLLTDAGAITLTIALTANADERDDAAVIGAFVIGASVFALGVTSRSRRPRPLGEGGHQPGVAAGALADRWGDRGGHRRGFLQSIRLRSRGVRDRIRGARFDRGRDDGA